MYSIEKDEIRRKIIVQATGIFKIVGMLAQRIYISDTVEKTAPAIVLQKFDSPNLSPLARSDRLVVEYTADRAGRGWASQIFVRRWPVLSVSVSLLSLHDMYVFFGLAR